jgi:hypothetical protein
MHTSDKGKCSFLFILILIAGTILWAGEDSDFGGILWSGRVGARERVYIDYGGFEKSTVEAGPEVRLDIMYAGPETELVTKFLFRRYGTPAEDERVQNVKDLVSEAYIRAYFDAFDVEAGLMKIVWGKGDNIHVLDVLNPTDYYDFINNEYLDRRAAELMTRVVFKLGDKDNLELVYAPVFTPDTVPREGPWTPQQVKKLLAGAAAFGIDPETGLVEEPLNKITDGTYGMRWTGSRGGFDLGLLYAYTFHRTPSLETSLVQKKVFLTYDRVHVFGLEAAAVIAGLNLRLEGGYFLSEDIEGKDPRVKNNQIGYVFGFDRDLPLSTLNFNAQIRGIIILGTDRIDENPIDTEYRKDGKYTEHIAAVRASDSWNRDRIKPEITFTLGIENLDWRLAPKISFDLADDFTLNITYVRFAGGRDTNFGQYKDSSFAEMGLQYRF